MCTCGDKFAQTKWGGVGECDNCSGIKFCVQSCYGASRFCQGCGGKFLPKELRFWEPHWTQKDARKYWSDQQWKRVCVMNKDLHDLTLRSSIATGAPAIGVAAQMTFSPGSGDCPGELSTLSVVGAGAPNADYKDAARWRTLLVKRLVSVVTFTACCFCLPCVDFQCVFQDGAAGVSPGPPQRLPHPMPSCDSQYALLACCVRV